jgi:hypothetical protein
MSNSKNRVDHYINLIIADSSISVCNNTDFTSYKTFTSHIFVGIKARNYSGIERYLIPIVNDLSYILGIPIKEASLYVARFFKDKKWEKYYEIVKIAKDEFSIFLVP